MRHITIWITATLAVVALVLAFQLNMAGVGGKEGGDTNDGSRPAATCTSTAGDSTAGDSITPPTSCPSPTATDAPAKPEPTGAETEHTGNPGENK
jgi:hypothetical protein